MPKKDGFWGILASILILVSCSRAVEPVSTVPPPHHLLRSAQTPQEAAQTFLEALQEGDEYAIREMALTREEFEKYVWPDIPASRPGTNLTVDFVWRQMAMRSYSQMESLIRRNKGKHYTLVRLEARKGVWEYPSFRLHKDTWLVVRDESGQQRKVKFFTSVMEVQGEFKIYSYNVS